MSETEFGPGTPRWLALSREAGIAGQSVSSGLTSLRRANYSATGLYSHAFFGLSIGIERALKLIAIIDYALDHHNMFPSSAILKNNYGHNIRSLYNHAISIDVKRSLCETKYRISGNLIEERIIDFLTNFAIRSRYYNLDYLTSGASGPNVDPILEWHSEIGALLIDKHYTEKRKTEDALSAIVAQELYGSHMFVRHTSEDGQAISDVETMSLQSAKTALIQKYGTYYCAKIARYTYMLIYNLSYQAHSTSLIIPHLDEFFFPFMNDDKYLLSRRTFPPRGQ